MIVVLAALFGLHALLFAVDEFKYHRARKRSTREKWGYPLDLLITATLAAYVMIVPYGEFPMAPALILVLAALFSMLKNESQYEAPLTQGERTVHLAIALLQPLCVLLLSSLWPVLRGVNFMVGAMLPFDTRELWPIFIGYAAALGGLGVYGMTRFKTPSAKAGLNPPEAESPLPAKAAAPRPPL